MRRPLLTPRQLEVARAIASLEPYETVARLVRLKNAKVVSQYAIEIAWKLSRELDDEAADLPPRHVIRLWIRREGSTGNIR